MADWRVCHRCKLGYRPRKATQEYCTPECRERERARRHRERNAATQRRILAGTPDKYCLVCGAPRPKDARFHAKLYCSRSCRQKAFNARRDARRKDVATGLPCRWCERTTTSMSGFCGGRCRQFFGYWRARYLKRFGFGPDW